MLLQLISGPNGYDFKSVRRWTSQRKLGYSLLECDKVIMLELIVFASSNFDCFFVLNFHLLYCYYQIFVPIHQEIHWCLAVINNKDKKLQYLDSMKGEDSSVLEKLVIFFFQVI